MITHNSTEIKQFVEDVGLFFERSGLPRMAGRILGWLLVCDPPHQSATDLAEVLEASKGSISSMTRLLIQIGLIQRTSLPGQRRDYFYIQTGAWFALLQHEVKAVAAFRRILEHGVALIADAEPATQERLLEIRDVYAFFERELPSLLERWEQERKEHARE